MSTPLRKRMSIGAAVMTVTLLAATLVSASPSGAASAPGFNGKVIKVGGITFATDFAGVDKGAEARFDRANATNELKGVKIDYVATEDDGGSVTTDLADQRLLVQQDGVFAVVPVVTGTAGAYLQAAKVPYFGWGITSGTAFCGPNDQGYGFGFSGCVLPTNPPAVPAFSSGNPYKYLTQVKGIKNPTFAMIGTNSASGKTSTQSAIAQATASGFKVVWAKNVLPAPPTVVGDYSPYAQQIMASNGGKGPDLMWITDLGSALHLPSALAAAGYKGMILSAYYAPQLLKPLAGLYEVTSFAPFEQNSAGTKQMLADLAKYEPGTQPSVGLAAGYFGADFFIKAVKKAGVKNLTRASLQKAAAHMTYSLAGTAGPTQYPRAFQALNSYCSAMVYDADGSAFTVAEPFTCTNKFVKVKKNSPTSVG